MYSTYCVFKPERLGDSFDTTQEQRVAYRNGEDCYAGSMDIAPFSVRDLGRVMRNMQETNAHLPYHCKYDDMDGTTKFKAVVNYMTTVSKYVMDEVCGNDALLEEMTDSGMHSWLEDCDESESFFELQTLHGSSRWDEDEDGPDVMETVDLACSRTFVGSNQVNLVYFQGNFFFTLKEATDEQPLLDRDFPKIGSKGKGFQIASYDSDEHPVFRKLSLWQVKRRQPPVESRSGESKAGGGEAKQATTEWSDDDEEDEMEQEVEDVDPNILWGEKDSAFYGSYNQTYLLYKAEPGSSNRIKRRAFFRYGNWCYAGHVNMDHPVQLVEVPHVLRKFQKQQGKLQFMCEVANLPDNTPYTDPMKRLAAASSFLEKSITGSEATLTKLDNNMRENDEALWINEETGRQYFELTTTGNTPYYDNIELIASKTYFKEVVLIILFFRGTYYVTLSPCIDDQPLLDMSFPDVSSKGRGFQIRSFRHREYAMLSFWEGTRSVWKVANAAVMEDRRRKAQELREKKAREAAARRTAEAREDVELETATARLSLDEGKQQSAGEETSVSFAEDDTIMSFAEEKTSPGGSRNPESRKHLSRRSCEMKQQGSDVRGPHHIKPMGDLRKASKLPDLDQDAPWDRTGKPRDIFSSKPLGSTLSSKK